MSLINDILSLLESQNKKQSDLCTHLSINTSTMTNWKNRNTDPPAKYIIPICEFLDVTPYQLLTGTEKKPSTELSDDELKLIQKYRGLKDIEKGIIWGRIEAMTAQSDHACPEEPQMTMVYQAARTYDHNPIPSTAMVDVKELEMLKNLPDSTDDY